MQIQVIGRLNNTPSAPCFLSVWDQQKKPQVECFQPAAKNQPKSHAILAHFSNFSMQFIFLKVRFLPLTCDTSKKMVRYSSSTPW